MKLIKAILVIAVISFIAIFIRDNVSINLPQSTTQPQISNQLDNKAGIKSEGDLTSIIAEWKPYVFNIQCYWKYKNSDKSYLSQAGSGTLMYDRNGIIIFTNDHVISDPKTGSPDECFLFGGREWFYKIGDLGFYTHTKGLDAGWIKLENETDKYIIEFASKSPLTQSRICRNVNLGDEIVVLGYPTIGASQSITATEGIISAIESDYYVTSAKIDHGNSGGAAIKIKDNCYLGIPTMAIAGEIESLGRILKASLIYK